MMKEFIVTDNNIHIVDSYTYSKKDFDYELNRLRTIYHDNAVLINRNNCSLKLEWATHNLLYNLHIQRERTKDVDLDYPQKWYYKVGYAIVGVIGLIFIK